MTVEAFAPAKINLTLHVTGQRGDGYHLLDSLVVFADVGDQISVGIAESSSLVVGGPMATGVPTGADNLVQRAAKLFGNGHVAALLTKNLPAASGIGGGSSDAAATLRAIAELSGCAMPEQILVLALGADVPVCLAARPVRMQGIGENLTPVTVPSLFMVLVNPGVSLATPQVFSKLKTKENPPMSSKIPEWSDTTEMYNWLSLQRNDLQAAAVHLEPEIQTVLDAITNTPGCRLSRMSGSGATCFGLYDSAEFAAVAAREIQGTQPAWWVKQAGLWQLPS